MSEKKHTEDWIKIRPGLYRHPKICLMADLLMDVDGELGRYVNQVMQRNMTVTRNVMRNVTVGALVSVWGVARHTGERRDNDLFLPDVTLAIIDDICDVPGFGEVMEHVGWAIQNTEGVVLPDFFKSLNVDPKEVINIQNAERQRRYRQKQSQKTVTLRNVTDNVTRYVTDGVTSNVTSNAKSNAREEKRREENNTPPCIPPEGETTHKRFVPPSLEEVTAYCCERENQVDPQRWIDHYTANGWKVGSNSMKDWRAAVRTWEKSERPQPAQQPPANPEVVWRAINSVGWDAKALEAKLGREWVAAVDAVGGWSVLRDVRGEFAIQQLNKKLAAEYARIRNGGQS